MNLRSLYGVTRIAIIEETFSKGGNVLRSSLDLYDYLILSLRKSKGFKKSEESCFRSVKVFHIKYLHSLDGQRIEIELTCIFGLNDVRKYIST